MSNSSFLITMWTNGSWKSSGKYAWKYQYWVVVFESSMVISSFVVSVGFFVVYGQGSSAPTIPYHCHWLFGTNLASSLIGYALFDLIVGLRRSGQSHWLYYFHIWDFPSTEDPDSLSALVPSMPCQSSCSSATWPSSTRAPVLPLCPARCPWTWPSLLYLPCLIPARVPACLHHGDICHPDFFSLWLMLQKKLTAWTPHSYVGVTYFFLLRLRGLLSISVREPSSALLPVSVSCLCFSTSFTCSFKKKHKHSWALG